MTMIKKLRKNDIMTTRSIRICTQKPHLVQPVFYCRYIASFDKWRIITDKLTVVIAARRWQKA